MTTGFTDEGGGGPTDPNLARTRRSDGDRLPLSPRILTLKVVRAKLRPEPARETIAALQGLCATTSSSGQKASPRVKSELGPLMTLGGVAAAGMRGRAL
jgi:hypothetical protein